MKAKLKTTFWETKTTKEANQQTLKILQGLLALSLINTLTWILHKNYLMIIINTIFTIFATIAWRTYIIWTNSNNK